MMKTHEERNRDAQEAVSRIVVEVVDLVLKRAAKERLADQAVVVVGSAIRAALTETERVYFAMSDEDVAWAEDVGGLLGRSLGESIAEVCLREQELERKRYASDGSRTADALGL